MPLPEPQSNESEDDFISRCLEWMDENDEGESLEQRSAICYSQWRDKEDVGDNMDRQLRVDEGQIKDWRYDEEDEVLVADVLMTKVKCYPIKTVMTLSMNFCHPMNYQRMDG